MERDMIVEPTQARKVFCKGSPQKRAITPHYQAMYYYLSRNMQGVQGFQRHRLPSFSIHVYKYMIYL